MEPKLKNKILVATDLEESQIKDITLCGSRLWGNPSERSDYDVVVWIEDAPYYPPMNVMYEGKRLSIKVLDIKYISKSFANQFILPKKSLLTGKIYNQYDHDIEAYLASRNRPIEYKDEFKRNKNGNNS